MADRNGVVIHEPPSPTNPHRPDVEREAPPAPCVACHAVHGGVGAEKLCLRAAVLERTAALGRLAKKYNEDMGAAARENEGLRGLLKDLQSKLEARR